jgi:type IV secretory pathway TrbF-like protein
MLRPRLFLLIGAIVVLAGCASPPPLAQDGNQTTEALVASSDPLSYEGYETVLRTYVNADGLVDYPALQVNPQGLKDFVAQLRSVSPDTYAAWSENEKIAFLINVYNAITLESIINQNPLKGSIKDIFGVWNFNKHTVMERSLTLDNIEHDILRKDFQEPRIHAALVCAAISCPPLRQEPYTGENLDEQLDDQVRKWLSSPNGLQIDRTQNRVAISSIFDWFGKDWQTKYAIEGTFTGSAKERSALNFISNYVNPEDKEYLEQGNYKLNYLNYDWSLNRQ